MVRLIKTQTNSEDGCWIVRTSGKVNHIPMEFETKLGSGDNFGEQLNPVIVFDALYKYVGINEGTEYEMINAMEKLITDVVKLKLYTDNELAFNFDVINLAQKQLILISMGQWHHLSMATLKLKLLAHQAKFTRLIIIGTTSWMHSKTYILQNKN